MKTISNQTQIDFYLEKSKFPHKNVKNKYNSLMKM